MSGSADRKWTSFTEMPVRFVIGGNASIRRLSQRRDDWEFADEIDRN